ncbi:alpha beta-hydrolase [Mucidula mucida]|nr:alpha beta-hydrolase [Mucidula mucida]
MLLCSILLVGCLVFLAQGHDHSPVVDLGYATYKGLLNQNVTNSTEFLGIRFAAPPLGSLRWRAPRTPKFAPGLTNATVPPPRCQQASTGAAPAGIFTGLRERDIVTPVNSEDCLFLNVYTPGDIRDYTRPSQLLPVLVWIHGGGYAAGGTVGFMGTDAYNGNDLIKESGNDVVVVVIQYRLGLFGFLAGEATKREGALNVGLLDQHFALEWVQSHISKFGGDAKKVTIWGQSAGAGSVLQHIIADNGNTSPPLFRGAITSSTFLPPQYFYNDTIPEALYGMVVERTNCSTNHNTLACLRNVETDVLETINNDINLAGFFGTYTFVPVVDGDLIRQRATVALKEGHTNGVRLMSITNSNEGALFVNASTADTVVVSQYLKDLFPLLKNDSVDTAVNLYAGLGTPIEQVTTIMAESIFVCPTYYLLAAFEGRAFKGEFAIPPGGHGNDVQYYFTSAGIPAFDNTAFIDAFSEPFSAFAKTLDPNETFEPTILPNWVSYNTESRAEVLFNRTESFEPLIKRVKTSASVLERCQFWESVGAETAQ